jgi:hypothetical protein
LIEKSEFKPPWYLKNPHLQTLLANLIKPALPVVQRETLALDDGDCLSLAHGTGVGNRRVLVLHGLEGSLQSAYARRVMHYFNAQSIPATLMFFRGCDGQPNRLARSYHSGDTGDLRQVIAHLERGGVERLALLGYSLGGNVTLKYLGEGPVDPLVACAVAVSVPLNLDICAKRMDRGFSRIYQRELLTRLRSKVAQKSQLLADAGIDPATRTRNFVEFDGAFTAPLHGYASAMDYYRRCSSRQFLRGIDRPTLMLHARDDPFMTERVIPNADELSDSIRFELSAHGGHVGFIEKGWLRQQNWLEPRIHRWLQAQQMAQ